MHALTGAGTLPTIDWNAAIFWLSAVQWLCTIAVGWYALSQRRRQATKQEIAAVEDRVGKRVESVERRLADHRDRLTNGDARFSQIEDGLKRTPSSENIHSLQLQLERVSGDLRVTNQAIKDMALRHDMMVQRVGIIDEHLRTPKP